MTFCASMADVFEDHPQVAGPRARLWALIEETPWLAWLSCDRGARAADRLSHAPWPASRLSTRRASTPALRPGMGSLPCSLRARRALMAARAIRSRSAWR